MLVRILNHPFLATVSVGGKVFFAERRIELQVTVIDGIRQRLGEGRSHSKSIDVASNIDLSEAVLEVTDERLGPRRFVSRSRADSIADMTISSDRPRSFFKLRLGT